MDEKIFREERNKLNEIRKEKQRAKKETIASARAEVNRVWNTAREELNKELVTLEMKIAGIIDGEFDRDIEVLTKKYRR